MSNPQASEERVPAAAVEAAMTHIASRTDAEWALREAMPILRAHLLERLRDEAREADGALRRLERWCALSANEAGDLALKFPEDKALYVAQVGALRSAQQEVAKERGAIKGARADRRVAALAGTEGGR